ERIYRIVETVRGQDGHMDKVASAPVDLSLTAGDKLSGVETIAPYVLYSAKVAVPGNDKKTIRYDNRIEDSRLPSTILAGPAYFRVFHYEWLAGNPSMALTDPNTIVLTKAKALKYFGNLSPEQLIGRDMVFNDSLVVRVTGIIKDWTSHTDYPFTEFISYSTRNHPFLRKHLFPDNAQEGFSPYLSRAFIKLLPGSSPTGTAAALHALAQTHPAQSDIRYDLTLQPLSDIHFDANIADGIHKAHLPTLYALMGIGVFILLLAAINFINLSTALSINRAKEIGIRKVIGGSRLSIAFQFLMETVLVTVAALVIAILAVKPVLSAFQTFLPKGVTAHLLNWQNVAFLLVLVLTTTLLAGLYPAKVLSGYLPVLSLKGPVALKGQGNWYFRKGLIVFQFAISLIFIISTVIISRQIDYMRTKDLGFNTDAVLSIDAGPQDRSPQVALFAERIRQLPGVQNVSRQSFTPLSNFMAGFDLRYKGKQEHKIQAGLQIADSNFIGLYDIHLLAGRNLIEGLNRDSINEFVINESLQKAAGFKTPQEAIGQFLYLDNHAFPIVGVVADYHENSYRQPIKPLVIFDLTGPEISFAVRLAAKGKDLVAVKNTLTQLEQVWKETYPGTPFSYSFLDDSIAAMYKSEQKTETLMTVAAAITIFISCMGLFGLSLFTADQRAKEVSIRKVLGAEVLHIASLLTRDYFVLIGLSLMIASPLAWYITHRWLEDFVYRAPVSIWTFLVSGGLVLLLGLLTVSIQTIRAATANPVKNLRAE
ncbi:MAG TPA: FtsX-like permease family protein, partial [Puia sp.]